MRKNSNYAGIDKDPEGAMNLNGRIIRDAWVFGLIPEEQTCAGWSQGAIDDLYAKVSAAWEPYGGLPSALPPELRDKHQRIYAAAIEHARSLGWNPDEALVSDN